MKCVYTRLLSDEELRAHLERGDVISFKDVSGEWHQIERQVERLGFGDVYAVSRCTRPGACREQTSIRVSPPVTQQVA